MNDFSYASWKYVAGFKSYNICENSLKTIKIYSRIKDSHADKTAMCKCSLKIFDTFKMYIIHMLGPMPGIEATQMDQTRPLDIRGLSGASDIVTLYESINPLRGLHSIERIQNIREKII